MSKSERDHYTIGWSIWRAVKITFVIIGMPIAYGMGVGVYDVIHHIH